MELNIQLKEQLAEVKAQLAIERGEREKEEEVRKCNLNFVKVRKKDLSIKLAELEAELEELKSRGKKDKEKRLPEANSPLAYLTFHDAEHNSSTDTSDNKLLSSPDQYRLFCESTNQHNTAVSQTAADIQEKKMEKVPEWQTTVEGQTGSLAFDLEDTTLKKHSGLSHLSGEPQRSISQPCDLDKELKCLREENAKEAERADQCQAKLEALQKQVTRETQQLTLAFERQSQHITDLLAELQEKESALLSQEGELQHCRQELAMLRAESEKQEKKGKKKDKRMAAGELEDVEQAEKKQECERGEEKPAEGGFYVQCYCSERATNNAVTINTLPKAAPTVPRDLAQPKMLASAAERQLAASNSQKASEEQADTEKLQSVALPQCFRDSDKSQNDQDKAHLMQTSHPKITYQDSGEHRQDSGTAHLVAELVSLQQENLQLKQRVQALTVLATTDPVNRPELQAISETQEISAEQNTDPGDEGTPTRSEERACSTNRPNNIITEEWQLTQQGGEKSKVIRTDEDRGIEAEEESHTVHKLQISLLEQQLVALQAELQALSEENQRQAEELTVWRLASQPIPAFDQNLTQTYNQSEIQDCTSALRCIQTPSFQKQTHYVTSDLSETQATLSTSCTQALKSTPGHGEQAALDVTQNSSTVTMVREDELILSCSSSRLHGHILATRLLQNNFPEPKSLLSSRKTSGPQDFIQHTAMVHEAFSEAFSDATKDPHAVSRPQTKDTKHPKGEPAAMPEAPRATSSLCTTVDSSGTERQGIPRNASTQTEEPPSPLTAPVPCKRHVHTQVEEEGEDEELADSLSVSPVSLPVAARFGDMALFSGSFPIPADPARLAERIRRNRSQLSAAFDDTEYEPYGLPEVVMKGFADIPSGPSCPYIVRRGLLGTAAVPLPNSETTQKEETD
ncbi:centromere protein F-like [Lampris incognitus]|uniref:centromere protein F-like n=1 Tax=Lampris incognitus TaxID=2546036 RepID=UPI0024B4C135|nr:centromere protein F-like [Lampris incognitus]